MIRTVIVDDESKSIDVLKRILTDYFNTVQVVDTACTTKDALEVINQSKPDLLLLDVVMPGENGFDLLSQVKDRSFEVIFCTGYDNYAIRAMRFAALDYLVKPVDVIELGDALKRVEQKMGEKNSDHRIEQFIKNNSKENVREQKLALPTSYGYKYVAVKDVIRCEADTSYTRFYIKGDTPLLVSKNLKEYEDLLTEDGFLRVHNSHLINLEHISKYVKEEGGYIVMSDGSNVELSRRRKAEFLEHLKALK